MIRTRIARLLMILFFFIITLCVMLDTSVGLKLIFKLLPGEIHAQKISGNLLHGWRMTHVHYTYDDFEITAEDFSLSWQPRDLLYQNVKVNKININNVTINIPTSTSSATTPVTLLPIHLPINIFLDNLIVKNVKIRKAKKEYFIQSGKLSGQMINNILTIQELLVQNSTLSSQSNGTINLNNWKNIFIKNKTLFYSHPLIPIFTKINGDKDNLSFSMKSLPWLDISATLKNYFKNTNAMIIDANWNIRATKTAFPELKNLNGILQFTGKAQGHLLQPMVSGKLLAKNITYDTIKIKRLNNQFNIFLDKQQKIDFQLSGNNISLGDTLLNMINFKLFGSPKNHQIHLNLRLLNNYYFILSSQGHFSNNTYELTNAKLNAEPLNLVFYPLHLNTRFHEKVLSYELQLWHNQEKLLVDGNTQLFSSDYPTYLNISSNRFTIINLPEYKITVSPKLTLDYTEGTVKTQGSLNILDANIAPLDFSNTVTLPEDIIYVDNEDQPLYKKGKALQFFTDVLLKIQKLFLNYKGIQAEISGETKLNQTPTTELNAYGQLKFLNGSYDAYGQKLEIQKNSSLNFSHAIDNPQLNITASKKIQVSPEYLVLPSYQPYLIAGVQVTGTADKPNIYLFSIPSGISQQDILSYLLFGFPQSQLTNSQASVLWNALSMMNTGGNNQYSLSSLQQSIQKEFNFSQFGLGNTSEYNAETSQYETGTAFVVGKRITNNLTATYNIGLMIPVNVLYLRYQLSRHWALQTDSSILGNGGDIIYSISRD